MEKNGFSARKLTLGGILLALSVIVLYFATSLPTSRLSLYALSSFFVSVIVMEAGVKTGWLYYISSSLLSFFLLHNKAALVPYIVFFGVYGIVKYYVEKIDKPVFEYVLKLVYFNVCVAAAYVFIKEVFLESIEIKFPWPVALILLQVIFIVYDYVYTLFIRYYDRKLKKMLRV